MKSDLSRDTFRPAKHYRGVLFQQGRVLSDADLNELQAIGRHHDEAYATDLVGPAGAPRVNPGFRISLESGVPTIGQGHFYLDGILCENEAAIAVTAQPDLPSLRSLPADDGHYLVYLEAWERHMTAVEDAAIRETALAGPDTATRTKTVWQVRLLRVTPPASTPNCDTAFEEWTRLLARRAPPAGAQGSMAVRDDGTAATDEADPNCVLPAQAGFRGLENQLYRVEIHRGGDRSEARFKWSRDNGTVASGIEPDPESGAALRGNEVIVFDIGRDDVLGFATEPPPEWVELSDDTRELEDQRGFLARVQRVDRADRRVVLRADSLPADRALAGTHPVLRRWDHGGDGATGDGVVMTGDWQPLERGVEVRFGAGTYKAGDYWLVPARTAVTLETGSVEWPEEGAADFEQLPRGTRHHFARLAVLRRSGGAYSIVADCVSRVTFPPLTAITAADVRFSNEACALPGAQTVQQALDQLCRRSGSRATLMLNPGDNVAAAVATIPDGQDAEIWFRVGVYTFDAPLVVRNKGHLSLGGAGYGVRLIAPRSEAALVFENCRSVTITDCHIEGGVTGQGTAALDFLNGAVTAVGCPSVTLDRVSLRCVGGPEPAATCLTVRNAAPAAGTEVRVRRCNLEIGHLQSGILLVNLARVSVEDNSLRVGTRPETSVLLRNDNYQALLRKQLLGGFRPPAVGGAAPAGTNARVRFNEQTVYFRSDPGLVRGGLDDNDWQVAVAELRPGGITSAAALKQFLEQHAANMIEQQGAGVGGSARFRTVIAAILAQDTPAALQGIVVGGTVATDVRIMNNTVRGVIQGVHVGQSQQGAPGNIVQADAVVVSGNTIGVSLPTTANRDRHGIFVGSCTSLLIEGNYLTLSRAGRNTGLRVQGMRIFGQLGHRAIVRHNHLGARFDVGISFAPIGQLPSARPLWIVTENVAVQSAAAFEVPQRDPALGRRGVTNPAQIRTMVIGEDNNYA